MPSVHYKKNRIITLLNDSTSGDVHWRPQTLISTNRWNKLRGRILIKICESGRWTEFAKTSLCIILVALIYLESAKIYTGPKIVRGLKRLRTTALRACLVCAESKAVWAQFSKVGLASDWKHVFSLSCQYSRSARQNESTARRHLLAATSLPSPSAWSSITYHPLFNSQFTS